MTDTQLDILLGLVVICLVWSIIRDIGKIHDRWMTSHGYQPEDTLDPSNPPKGGSGVPNK